MKNIASSSYCRKRKKPSKNNPTSLTQKNKTKKKTK